MKTRSVIIIAICCTILAFLSGAWVSFKARPKTGTESRKILYYVDPMHPSYKSDKPGIAPDCGMQLEPVYADGAVGGSTASSQLPPGTVQVSPEKLQTIGVKIATVEKTSGSQTLRVPGRVAPDERRVYRLTAAVDGWVQSIGTATTGSMVKKDETLLSFYAPDFLAAIQAYIFALGSLDRTLAVQGNRPANQKDIYNTNLLNYQNTLRNLGMSELQMAEIAKSRESTDNIRLVAPGNGLVLVRNVFPGLKFERGTEFFRIADLSRVWILADTYGSEADGLKPGTLVKVSIPNRNRVYTARVSNIPPIFDQNSRTLKVRLEVDNPGLILRPDMFVDIELPLRMPAKLSVPTEAILDSGLKKTVFVEKGPGLFEPREVETGRSFGERVEIVSGLNAGERIVVSGTFLIDSESRMKSSAAGISSAPQLDPSCGMYVDEAKARAAGHFLESGGTTYYFCSEECKRDFLKNNGKTGSSPSTPATGNKGMTHTMDKNSHDHMNMNMSGDKMPPSKVKPKDMPGSTSMPQNGDMPNMKGMTHTMDMDGHDHTNMNKTSEKMPPSKVKSKSKEASPSMPQKGDMPDMQGGMKKNDAGMPMPPAKEMNHPMPMESNSPPTPAMPAMEHKHD